MYLDGGINHNNPIAIADGERKLLWPDMAKRYPDIILSVGSGHCKTLKLPKKQPKAIQRVGISSNIKALYRIAVDHIESSLNSEAAWHNYMGVLAPADDEMFRFQRFNVELECEPPKLDDIDGMEDLEYTARQQWSRTKRLSNVARHLVATCFFFEKTRVEPLGDNSYECTGTGNRLYNYHCRTYPAKTPSQPGSIQCRFTPSTNNIQYLGEFLRDRQNHSHSLYFVIRERYRETDARQLIITQKVIEEMMSSGRFSMGQIKFPISSPISSTEILLSFGNDEYFLSGFPRMLPQEDPPRSKSTPCLHFHFYPIPSTRLAKPPRTPTNLVPSLPKPALIFWHSSHPPPGRQLLPHPHPLAAATPGPVARPRGRRHPQRRPRARRHRHHLALLQSRLRRW